MLQNIRQELDWGGAEASYSRCDPGSEEHAQASTMKKYNMKIIYKDEGLCSHIQTSCFPRLMLDPEGLIHRITALVVTAVILLVGSNHIIFDFFCPLWVLTRLEVAH